MTVVSRNGIGADLDKWRETQRASAVRYAEKRRLEILLARQQGTRTAQRRTRVKPVSDQRAVEAAIYRVRRVAFLEAHPVCQFPLGCPQSATTIQHRRGRIGDRYLDERFWAASCIDHNLWAEDNPTRSQEIGWSLPRVGLIPEDAA